MAMESISKRNYFVRLELAALVHKEEGRPMFFFAWNKLFRRDTIGSE